MAVVLRLHGLISSGEFSTLFLAQRNTDTEIVVVKCFDRSFIRRSPEAVMRVVREKWAMETLARLPHPCIVANRFAHIDDGFVFLGMENVGGGDVCTELQRTGPFPPERVRVYAAEICMALGHMHSFDIMFRDLKVRPPASHSASARAQPAVSAAAGVYWRRVGTGMVWELAEMSHVLRLGTAWAAGVPRPAHTLPQR